MYSVECRWKKREVLHVAATYGEVLAALREIMVLLLQEDVAEVVIGERTVIIYIHES